MIRLQKLLLGLGIVLLGALGFLAASTLQHLLADHQRVDQLWELEIRRAQAAQAAQQAQQPPPGAVK